jgi:hypothetical protein
MIVDKSISIGRYSTNSSTPDMFLLSVDQKSTNFTNKIFMKDFLLANNSVNVSKSFNVSYDNSENSTLLVVSEKMNSFNNSTVKIDKDSVEINGNLILNGVINSPSSVLTFQLFIYFLFLLLFFIFIIIIFIFFYLFFFIRGILKIFLTQS